MKKRKLWLSRQRDGSYMLTFFKPVICNVMGTHHSDFYIAHGEPIGMRHLCEGGVLSVFGFNLEIGESVEVYVQGEKK